MWTGSWLVRSEARQVENTKDRQVPVNIGSAVYRTLCMFGTTYNGSKEVLAVTIDGTDLSIALEGEVR